MTVDEEHHKLAYENAVYREQLSLLQREMDRITLATMDLSNAAKTVEKISDGEGLIPIGGGAYVRAAMSTQKILIPIGSGYIIEMDKNEAEVEIKKRMGATERAIEKLNEEFGSLSKKFQESGTKLRDLQNQLALSKRVDENIGEDYL